MFRSAEPGRSRLSAATRRISAILAVAALTQGAIAQNLIYVSASGSDAAAGTQQAPLATITKAVGLARRSVGPDTILLRRGETFGRHVSDGLNLDGLTIGAYGDGRLPIIKGPGGIQFHSEPVNNLTIQDIYFEAGLRRPDDPNSEDGGISIAPGSRGVGFTVRRCVIIGGDEGIRVSNYENVLFENVLIARQLYQGILIGGVGGWTMRDSALIHNGWRLGMEGQARDTFRDHGIYANQNTTNVVLDRVIIAHSNNCGWKAETGGLLKRSLLLGNPVQIGLGGGLGNATLRSEGNVITYATETELGKYAVVLATGGAGSGGNNVATLVGDVIGPPVRADRSVVNTPFGGVNQGQLVVNLVGGTVMLGYNGAPSLPAFPAGWGVAEWDAKAMAWAAAGGVTGQMIDAERQAAKAVVLGGSLATDLPPQEQPSETEPPTEPAPDAGNDGGNETPTPPSDGSGGDDVVSNDPPAEETPAEETPADNTPPTEPADDTDTDVVVNDPPAEETPAEETPAEETPADNTPPAEPADDDTDVVVNDPPAEETPAEETPAEETPSGNTPPVEEEEPVLVIDTGDDAKAVARWTAAPHQMLQGSMRVGVLAFHVNAVDRVEFSVNGEPWQSVSAPTLNNFSALVEYQIYLRPNAYPDGPVTINAIAYPKRGLPRVLEPLQLHANYQRSVPSITVYVSPNTGDDELGSGSRRYPFQTVAGALTAIVENVLVDHPLDNVTLYLDPGTWDLTAAPAPAAGGNENAWLTIASRESGFGESVTVTAQSGAHWIGASHIRFSHVRVHRDLIQAALDRGCSVWIDQSTILADGEYEHDPRTGPGRLFITDSVVEADSHHAVNGADLARSVWVKGFTGDAFRNVAAVVNCLAEQRPSPAPDADSTVLTWTGSWDNTLVYNFMAPDTISRALSVRPDGDNVADRNTAMAFANTVLNTYGDEPAEWAVRTNHLIIWHSAILGQPLHFDPALKSQSHHPLANLSIRNSIFHAIDGAGALPVNSTFANGILVQGIDNNHYIEGLFVGTSATTGEAAFASPETGDFRPVIGTALDARVFASPLAADLEGNSYDNPAPIGPINRTAQPTNDTEHLTNVDMLNIPID